MRAGHRRIAVRHALDAADRTETGSQCDLRGSSWPCEPIARPGTDSRLLLASVSSDGDGHGGDIPGDHRVVGDHGEKSRANLSSVPHRVYCRLDWSIHRA